MLQSYIVQKSTPISVSQNKSMYSGNAVFNYLELRIL